MQIDVLFTKCAYEEIAVIIGGLEPQLLCVVKHVTGQQ
jgi:hypothetical protein